MPEPDLEGMAAINLDEDVSRGVENNYSLKILEKKIAKCKKRHQQNQSGTELKEPEGDSCFQHKECIREHDDIQIRL